MKNLNQYISLSNEKISSIDDYISMSNERISSIDDYIQEKLILTKNHNEDYTHYYKLMKKLLWYAKNIGHIASICNTFDEFFRDNKGLKQFCIDYINNHPDCPEMLDETTREIVGFFRKFKENEFSDYINEKLVLSKNNKISISAVIDVLFNTGLLSKQYTEKDFEKFDRYLQSLNKKQTFVTTTKINNIPYNEIEDAFSSYEHYDNFKLVSTNDKKYNYLLVNNDLIALECDDGKCIKFTSIDTIMKEIIKRKWDKI
jgi:hypothetical protein